MIKRVLVIGGYGNFGSFISQTLAKETNIQVIIAGRNLEKAETLANEIESKNKVEVVVLDINTDLNNKLALLQPDIVIHTSGPFQSQGYDVAQACIEHGIHYIDLADGRDFVSDIYKLDKQAKENHALVISGASSVPCLTSALIDHYIDEFDVLESVDYGITTAQQTARGLATTAAILAYTGKPFNTLLNGKRKLIYGWQNLRLRKYAKLGWRLLGNCDIPDLTLFPKRYPSLKNIRFFAGLELPFIHITLWFLSWLVRFKIINKLEKAAPLLLRTSFMFDWFGSANSAFHMTLSGKENTKQKSIVFELTALSGEGPYIPCMPAILMAKKLANGQENTAGAYPCMGFISRDEYLAALSTLDISWHSNVVYEGKVNT